MSLADDVKAPIRHADRFFIGGQWVQPSSDATIKVIDSGSEELFFSVAEAQAADISRAVEAARQAFDAGPWPRLTHAERAGYLRAIGAELSVSFGGFKQSGIGREGLLPFLETKFVILEGRPAGYEHTTLQRRRLRRRTVRGSARRGHRGTRLRRVHVRSGGELPAARARPRPGAEPEDRGRGAVQPRAPGHPLRQRGRSGRPRQPHLVRAVLLGVVGRHRTRHEDRRAAPHRRHLLQQPQRHRGRRARAVRRVQRQRHRPRTRPARGYTSSPRPT